MERRENFLADFAETQKDLSHEFGRLSKFVSKSKPGLSAMKQLAFALKQIKNEGELYEAMRRVRLKPSLFTRVGRPPKKRPLLELKTKEPREKRTKRTKKDQDPPLPLPEVTTEVVTEALVTEVDADGIPTITLSDETLDGPTSAAIDISFLFN